MVETLLDKFSNLNAEELEKEVFWRKECLCQGMTVEDLDILITEIEVLEFLLKKKSECVE